MLNKLHLLLIFLLLGSCLTLGAIDWQTWRYGDIQIYSAPKDAAYASLIVKRLAQRINAFQMELGVYPTVTLVIKILPNRQEYTLLTTGKGKIVASSQAFYSPSEKVIYVRSPDQISVESYDSVLMHEYIHWFLDETLINAPLWFHEGMAFFYSGQFNFATYYSFTRYRFMGYKLSLNDMIYQYPKDQSYWNMFYLTSAFAVNHLQSKHHEEWQTFWDNVGFAYNRTSLILTTKADFYKVFYASFKMSLHAYSREFDKVIKRYGWQFPLIGINALIFSILPFVIIAAWLKHRRKLKAMPDITETEPDISEEPEAEIEEANPPPIP